VYIGLPFWNCSFVVGPAVLGKIKLTGLASIP
jgi:hypothetical protein